MGKSYKTRPGFTLFELILVIMLIVFLFSVAINGMVRTQASYEFSESVQKVLTMIRKARSYAVTGKAMPDFTDFDQDGCKLTPEDALLMTAPPTTSYQHGSCANPAETDYVAPANYGVFFYSCYYTSNTNCSINLFADINNVYRDSYYYPWLFSNTATPFLETNFLYNSTYDVLLERLDLPKNIYVTTLNDDTLAPYNRAYFGVLYSPIFADVKLGNGYRFNVDPYPYNSIKFRIQYGYGTNPQFKRCFQIHKVSGNPEQIPCS